MDGISFLLGAHIAGGSGALLFGLFNILNRKGSDTHRKLGKIYTASMAMATLSGTLLAVLHPNHFLFLIGIFSFYLCYSGWRILSFPRQEAFRVAWHDWLVAAITAMFSALMIGASVYNPAKGAFEFNVVLLVFGSGGLSISLADLRLFYRLRTQALPEKSWLTTHIGRMGGSYISAVTAFLVVNVDFLPSVLIWLGPSAIGTIFISRSIAKVKRSIART